MGSVCLGMEGGPPSIPEHTRSPHQPDILRQDHRPLPLVAVCGPVGGCLADEESAYFAVAVCCMIRNVYVKTFDCGHQVDRLALALLKKRFFHST